MVEVSSQDLICLHLNTHVDDAEGGAAPRALTAIGIGDAIELGETSADRVRLLDDLEALESKDYVESEERSVEGFDAPRTIYKLTPAGQERSVRLRRELESQSITITNGTAKEVKLSNIHEYLPDTPVPLVTALARLTDEDTVSLDDSRAGEFIDREAALESVTDSIEASFSRESRSLMVRGAAGIGKTALIIRAVEKIERSRPALLTARGNCQPDPTPPYQPFMQAFEQLPNTNELNSRIEAASSAIRPEDPQQLEAQRTALFNDIAERIQEASTQQPIVLFLDDLHWAAKPTLDLFNHLSSEIDELVYPVAFVTTARHATARIDSMEPATDVRLEPLNSEDTRALIEGVAGSQQVPDAFFEFVYRKTGGNPLYIRETVLHLKEAGRIDPEAGVYLTSEDEIELPSTVTDQIEERLSSLDDVSRELLQIGAVIGERIPGDILAKVVDLGAADRRDYIDILLASRIWESLGEDYRFVSSGIREAVVDRLTPDLEKSLHARVAESYLDVFGTDLTNAAARVAHHFEQAGKYEQAIEFYLRAGEHAMATYANKDAIDHYQSAISLDQGNVLEDIERAEIRSDLASVYDTMGAFDSARNAIEEGLETVPYQSRAECRLLGQLASTCVQQGDYDAAMKAAQRQRELANQIDARNLLMEAIRQEGNVAFEQGRYDDALEFYEGSLALTRELEAKTTEAEILSNLGMVAFRRGRFSDARDHYRRSLKRARDLDDPEIEAKVLNSLGVVAFKQGEYDNAWDYYDETLEIAQSIGDRQAEGHSLNNLGLISQRQAKYQAACRYYEQSLELHEKVGNRPVAAINLANIGLVAQRRGRYEEAREFYHESLEISRDIGKRLDVARSLNNLGSVALRTGDLNQAEDFIQRSLEITEDISSPETAADARLRLGLLLMKKDELNTAREMIEESIETFESIDDQFGVAEPKIAAAHVAHEDGRQEEALELARRVESKFQQWGAIHWLARSRVLLGRIMSSVGREKDAISHLRPAIETFREIGAYQDALQTLEYLVTGHLDGKPEEADKWCHEAREVLKQSPRVIAEQHREWVEECESVRSGG